MPTHTLIPTDVSGLSPHDVLGGGLADQITANFYAAQQLERLDEFYQRCEADYEARLAASRQPRFVRTPLQETALEASSVWGKTEHQVRTDLRTVRMLKLYFPVIWALCLSGALDIYKASLIADTAKFALGSRKDLFPAFADRLTRWLVDSLRTDCDLPAGQEVPGLVSRTVKQLRNKLHYETTKLKPRDAEERFKSAHQRRSARTSLGEDGIGNLTVDNAVHDVQIADYRLTLIARALRAQGDARTQDQIRADVAMDLLIGRATVDPSLGELEEIADTATPDQTTPPGEGVVRRLPVGKYARPIVNVTVPIQTLMGFSDHPGTLSGGTVVPASLVRMIAADQNSTWYRMLTDEQNRFVELSTKSYQPTEPMWRALVARDRTCYLTVCDRAATDCEIDHREPWPAGDTSMDNLRGGCKPHHLTKHSPGFRLDANLDGTVTLHTRAGFAHTSEQVEQPALTDWPEDELFETQHTAAEILDALHLLQAEQRANDLVVAGELDEDAEWELSHAS